MNPASMICRSQLASVLGLTERSVVCRSHHSAVHLRAVLGLASYRRSSKGSQVAMHLRGVSTLSEMEADAETIATPWSGAHAV